MTVSFNSRTMSGRRRVVALVVRLSLPIRTLADENYMKCSSIDREGGGALLAALRQPVGAR